MKHLLTRFFQIVCFVVALPFILFGLLLFAFWSLGKRKAFLGKGLVTHE